MKMTVYQFQSCFAPYIEKFLQEKRAVGFIYESAERRLKYFDAFCLKESVTEPIISRELVKKWGILRGTEALSTCSGRTSVLRQFALFLTSLGMEAYIPTRFYKAEKKIVHILSDNEVLALFQSIDSYVPAIKIPDFLRLSVEYKVVFRLIYCCGLRISEARKLQWSDVDLERRAIRVLQSKGRKDRLVYMAEDLTELIRLYKDTMKEHYHCSSKWVFPAREPGKCLTNGTLDTRFRKSWAETVYAKNCDRVPTVHCLRYGFVVKRMNLWMEEGIPLKEMLPFLSRYLGHASPNETFYYYYQVDSAFRIIRDRDKTGVRVIPEVHGDE